MHHATARGRRGPGSARHRRAGGRPVTAYGFDGLTAAVQRSDDSGHHWQRGASMAGPDLDVDPENPMRVVGATRDGLEKSPDGRILLAAGREGTGP